MDDDSWDFFCNNSPRLVEKKRSKTPVELIESKTLAEVPKIMLSHLRRSKVSETNKSSIRIVYRDQTPPKIMMKNNSKLSIKPLADARLISRIDLAKKSATPVKSLKRSPISSKRLILAPKDKLIEKSSKLKPGSNIKC